LKFKRSYRNQHLEKFNEVLPKKDSFEKAFKDKLANLFQEYDVEELY
ncbi:unnamed protein product, partial [Brachionus calyciflorus]